jgi:hypothetical protein
MHYFIHGHHIIIATMRRSSISEIPARPCPRAFVRELPMVQHLYLQQLVRRLGQPGQPVFSVVLLPGMLRFVSSVAQYC